MKKLFFLLIAILPLISQGQNLTPECVWADDNHRDWSDKGIGTTFLSYNGLLFSFNYQGNGTRQGGHSYMYTINETNQTTQSGLDNVNIDDYKVGPDADHDNRLEFKFPAEGSSYDEGAVLGRSFTFQFDGRGWYFIHIRSADQDEHSTVVANESYECLAQLPTTTSVKCHTYYHTAKPVSTVLKQGAFQYDSLLYFLAYDQTQAANTWQVEEFKFTSSDGEFDPTNNNIQVTGLYPYLGSLIRRLDLSGNEYMLATFYDQSGHFQLGKFTPTLSGGKRSWQWTLILDHGHSNPFNTAIAATTMVEGTIKGGRSASQITNKTESDRLIFFGEYLNKSSDGNYHVQYAEYHFSNDQLVKDGMGEITLPTSYGPATVAGTWRMHAAFQLRPMDYSGAIPGTDGYEQYIWLVYPDKNRHYHGVMFKSDTWINDPDWVESGDLDQDTTYPGVKDCWSLLGIVDGPPPVSMNWAKWDSTWGFPVPATTLEFESDTSGATEFVTQTEHEWSIGESVEIKKSSKRMKASLGEKFKYSSTWENTVSNSQSWSSTYTLPIEMEEESQEYGYYIYSVPQLRRFSYALYPWWDDLTLQQYPNMNSFQYLFLTIANTIVPYPVPLSSYPFHVNEPNARNMKEWSEYEGRSAMHKEAADHGLFPVLHLDWTNLSNGSTMSIQTSIEGKTSDSQTNAWDFEVEAGGGLRIPKVCRIETQLSTGYSGSLMNETTTTSEYGRRITASLKQLHFTSQGVNLSALHMNLYLFSPETNANWSYFDSLNGQKPFYLAWEVTSASESLALESPADGDQVEQDRLLFTWRPNGGELRDYVFIISGSSNIADVTTLYRQEMGTATELAVNDFQPEPGVTYYWAVKGYNADGDLVFSPIRSFTMKKAVAENPSRAIKTVICSSPGPLSDLRIIVSPVNDGLVAVTLTDLSGQAVAIKETAGRSGVAMAFSFSGENLAPGIYLAVIRSGNDRVVRKVIIR